MYFIASSKVHSEFEDGLDSGKMIGRVFHWPILVSISGVNALPMVDRPRSIVGLTYSTVWARVLNCFPWLSVLEK